jgi:asparagine synthase (glutamine-hydrolysing)
MCGICGKISWKLPPDQEIIRRMTAQMAHRGPDNEGIYCKGPVVLGHRRLSVIDTSQAGNQPMADASGKLWIVYNGEIYNFMDIRNELITAGYEFKSRTDTEVILAAYDKWGIKCLERFIGMFAFAIWDASRQQIVLARDRLGKKPLYFKAFPNGDIVFASELRALLMDPSVGKNLNFKALGHYLSLNYTLTGECIIEGVHKLEAAHYLIFGRTEPLKIERYWNLADCFISKKSYKSDAEAADRLQEILESSVRLRMISDVPLGAFLSGGLDSSSIVSAMTRIGSPESTFTFSIGFNEKTYSELEEAEYVAKLLNVRHQDKIVNADMAAGMIAKIVSCLDEPFADTSMIPMYFLSEFARKNVTVTLSGDGGDEIFAGYPTYIADKIHSYTRHMPLWTVNIVEKAVNKFLPVTFDKVSLDYKIRQFLKGQHLSPARAHCFWRLIFSEREKQELLNPDLSKIVSESDPFNYYEPFQQETASCHYLDQAMYMDIKTWLVDDILVKLDRMTMGHSLEARAPMLDHRLVEFAASLPVSMKLKGFRTKHLLKKSQTPFLPGRVIDRSKKGFNAPVSHWINTALLADIEQIAEGCGGLFDEILAKDKIRSLCNEHKAGIRDNGLKLFSLIVLKLWIDQVM